MMTATVRCSIPWLGHTSIGLVVHTLSPDAQPLHPDRPDSTGQPQVGHGLDADHLQCPVSMAGIVTTAISFRPDQSQVHQGGPHRRDLVLYIHLNPGPAQDEAAASIRSQLAVKDYAWSSHRAYCRILPYKGSATVA